MKPGASKYTRTSVGAGCSAIVTFVDDFVVVEGRFETFSSKDRTVINLPRLLACGWADTSLQRGRI